MFSNFIVFAFELYTFERVASGRSACELVANVVCLSFLLLICYLNCMFRMFAFEYSACERCAFGLYAFELYACDFSCF